MKGLVVTTEKTMRVQEFPEPAHLWHYCPNCGAQMHEDDFCSYGECREGNDEK